MGLKTISAKFSLGRSVAFLGRIGKALMFPIAVLPIAALLLRIGAQVPQDTTFSAFVHQIIFGAGNIVFANLPIIFAIGVGFGLTKDNRGEAALSAFLGMALLAVLMRSDGVDLPDKIYGSINFSLAPGTDASASGFHRIFGSKYDAILAENVLNGIVAGSLVAWLYNRFNGAVLPKVLGFFSGRRLIPVLSIMSVLILGVAYAVIYPWVGYLIYRFSLSLSSATGQRYANAGIMGIYVLINRLLIPFGLHHIPNTMFWFQLGEHTDHFGNLVQGDINIFISGVAKGNTAGTFQSGFFPMMMFGLPALVMAIYKRAQDRGQKQQVLAMLGGSAFVSMLTGITEPIEFAFLFAATPLFIAHALLGGLFAFITGLFGIQLGFGFSAGLIDYLLSIPKSIEIINANLSGINAVLANPGWIFAIGLVCALFYYFGGLWAIGKFNFATPGRSTNLIFVAQQAQPIRPATSDQPAFVKEQASIAEPAKKTGSVAADEQATNVEQISSSEQTNSIKPESTDSQSTISARTAQIVLALGGYDNITNFQNCATRLRYDVKDADKVDRYKLISLGILGVMKVSKTHVQLVVGPQVEALNDEIIRFKDVDLSQV
ncbi:PTS transporter subunit EIIC [Mycoplasma sp. ATU-Cv-508]|uniref:PTS transporter subunit EIIC n=1 Tax=Mycoplasma sp. ATU-Cv-508 TaxID=2048001 RepID=UPI000FDF1A95